MAVRPGGRAGESLVVRRYDGKTAKVTVHLPPPVAAKLRVAAVGLGVDLGDLVTLGLEPVLRSIEVRVRLLNPGQTGGEGEDPSAGSRESPPPPALRAV